LEAIVCYHVHTMANSEGRFLTVREVAERLRLHPITVRRHIKAGLIRAVRIGRAVRVPEEELARFIVKGDSRTNVAEVRARYGVKSPARVEFERRLRGRSSKERAEIREAFERLRELRDSMEPMDVSTAELVRQAKQEIEDRDERRARGSS